MNLIIFSYIKLNIFLCASCRHYQKAINGPEVTFNNHSNDAVTKFLCAFVNDLLTQTKLDAPASQ